MHIGSPGKLTDYLKTVEFDTLKTSQFKKRKNAVYKTYTLSVQYFHRSGMLYILKFNMYHFVTKSGPT